MGQRRLVQGSQLFNWSVRIGGGLEIGNKLFDIIEGLQTSDANFKLVHDILPRNPAAWAKTAVITECATAGGHGTINIGTCKTSV